MPHAHFCLQLTLHLVLGQSPLQGISWAKPGERLCPDSLGDGGQPEMLPQPLCMPTTALSSLTLQTLFGVVLLHMV